MPNPKWYKKPEMIVAFSALFISLVTTVVGIYSAYIDREYARASVWPRLVMYSSSFPTPSFHVSNRGTGPALIKYAKINDGEKYVKYWIDIRNFPTTTVQSHVGGMTLPSNESIPAIAVHETSSQEQQQMFTTSMSSVTVELCYCSIYEECWLLDKGNKTTSVDNCEINDEERFLQ
ncbi:hypothetical protein [Paraglaciecola marina]|uniref:hypothetical protein n=1 Tax=Paraglaciecola marina TaxID=2500157 RepID=UPI00105E631C|nr:hypothetical protein [Paraglaciecola marina]